MLAACSILFESTGGLLRNGRPILTSDPNGSGGMVRAGNPNAVIMCDRAFDCGTCTLLHKWLNEKIQQGYRATWECHYCLRKTKKSDGADDIERVITGYYQAGRKGDLSTDDKDYDPDRPGLQGCTHILESDDPDVGRRQGEMCLWESSFLQLVLRRKRQVGDV